MTVESSAVTIEENRKSSGNPIPEYISGSRAPHSQDKTLAKEHHIKAIEVAFPVEEISRLAERESYRKEIFRPIYHIHKWWANRLGSVFRGIVLGAVSRSNSDIWKEFYKKHNLKDVCVLDPFMGSGTTLGEAAKLGAKPVGCDINPISTFAVRQALTTVDIDELVSTFHKLEVEVKPEIGRYYTTLDRKTNLPIPVLYYFWVKLVETPGGETVPLFNSYVFSKHTYPNQKPSAQIICPACWSVNTGRHDAKSLKCQKCHHEFNPQNGPVNNQFVKDGTGNKFKIKELIPKNGRPLRHRLYAIMALNENGEKVYLTPDAFDFKLVEEADQRLTEADLPLPTMPVRTGYNTNQARGYNYLHWRDFFNSRQLLCLGLLLKKIQEIECETIKDQFLCLFSSTLEFNNLFCSFKGEGTGAVRHMFSHHILKPERTPLENSVWGTPKSSGTFSSLFKSRLLKAKAYLQAPSEIYFPEDMFGNMGEKSQYLIASDPVKLKITSSWEEFIHNPHQALVLNGDSAALPIPDSSIDAVITDPPYFDFVHYSELSDFFFAWLAPVLSDRYPYFDRDNSYHKEEVQNKDPDKFAAKLGRVFRESHRVLKDNGILSFSFHHSRPEGWAAIYRALRTANFSVIASYPIHAEMKVASPKINAKEPISLDMILVCKKQGQADAVQSKADLEETLSRKIRQMENGGNSISKSDRFNIKASLALTMASGLSLPPEGFEQLIRERCNAEER